MKSRPEAEEALNDTFLKCFDHLEKFNPDCAWQPWLGKITVNTCIDRLRAKKRLPSLVALSSIAEPRVADDDFVPDLDQNLLSVIQKLPTRYRTVFNLYVFEEYKHQEIADVLGISVGTSKSNYARAKAILKKKMHRPTKGLASIWALSTQLF